MDNTENKQNDVNGEQKNIKSINSKLDSQTSGNENTENLIMMKKPFIMAER